MILSTNQVFGVSSDRVRSYIERNDVDKNFVDGLSHNRHIVVFGSSKQGKTALTIEHLTPEQYVKVECSPLTKPIDIYKSILRQLGIIFKENHTESSSNEISRSTLLKSTVCIPYTSVDSTVSNVAKSTSSSGDQYKHVEYNLNLAQDISEILISIGFNKRIILENFHYLDEEVQQKMAFDLRTFEGYKILFIILGIWREKNRLSQFNGDLQDRIIEIPVEPWEKTHLKEIITKGKHLLNVLIPDSIFEEIYRNSFGSVGVFQELCKESCYAAGTNKTEDVIREIDIECVKKAIDKKINDYSSRHIRSLETFINQQHKTSDDIPLYIPYYFLVFLINTEIKKIEDGFRRADIHSSIQNIHHNPERVRASDISNFLYNITKFQISKKIQPPIFDYDRSTKKMRIIDSTLYFFLKNTDKQELLDSFDTPIEIKGITGY